MPKSTISVPLGVSLVLSISSLILVTGVGVGLGVWYNARLSHLERSSVQLKASTDMLFNDIIMVSSNSSGLSQSDTLLHEGTATVSGGFASPTTYQYFEVCVGDLCFNKLVVNPPGGSGVSPGTFFSINFANFQTPSIPLNPSLVGPIPGLIQRGEVRNYPYGDMSYQNIAISPDCLSMQLCNLNTLANGVPMVQVGNTNNFQILIFSTSPGSVVTFTGPIILYFPPIASTLPS